MYNSYYCYCNTSRCSTQLWFEQTCAPSKCGNNIVTTASFQKEECFVKISHYLGRYLCKSILVWFVLYMLCVYNTTDHILPVFRFSVFFRVLTAFYIQFSSLLTPQLKDCQYCGSTTDHCTLLPQHFGQAVLKLRLLSIAFQIAF